VPERLADAAACQNGQGWEWDGVRFEILHPHQDSSFAGNNLSCVLRIVSPYGRALLPGDIAALAERAILQAREGQLAAEVLVVPHHGSKSSSTTAFLDKVRPRVALLPVGYRNRYHHPHPAVVARYVERGIALQDSATAGAIRLRLDAAGLQIDRYRDTQRRYWHGQ